MATQAEKALGFAGLHERDRAFVIPNPWDPGSAVLLAALGVEALATTSSGFANSIGRADGAISLEEKIEHCRSLCAVTDLPVSADLEKCFSDSPEGVAETIRLAAEAGVVGASIEDYSGSADKPIYEFELAVERVQAAVEAAQSLDFHFTLTARAENLLRGRNDMDDTIRRLQAFEKAGADVLYAPALRTLEEVRTVVGAVDKPVNVLAPPIKNVTVAQLSEAGVKRISIGGALARAVVATLLRAGAEMRDQGSFGWTADATPGGEINRLLGARRK
jgi:2-methylisocitrate lyase-like PEP mutase family enzyme